jgi:FkbM family methyltransferase
VVRPRLASQRRLLHPVRFSLDQVRGSDDFQTWKLRDGGALVLRPRSRDIAMFREVYGRHVYDPPAEVRGALGTLGRPPRILDLGANVGITAVRFRQLFPHSTIVSYEPDPDNLRVLRQTHAANNDTSWQIIEACAGVAPGLTRFISGQQANSHLATDDEPGAIECPVVDAMPDVVDCDLLKIDIEGGEWALLTDPRWSELRARAVVMEHHGRHSPPGHPRDTASVALRRLGFTVRYLPESTPSLGMLWAWREI